MGRDSAGDRVLPRRVRRPSADAAHQLIADALDLKHRLPRLWRRVQALEGKVSYARYVARETRDLQAEQAAYVDSRVAEVADGRVTWTRFEDVRPGHTDRRARDAGLLHPGQLRGDHPPRRHYHEASSAGPSQESDPIDWADLLPEVTLHVHCYAGPEPTGVVRVEGVGSISEEWLRRLLGEPARFRVQPVLDIEGQAPVDGYEIPDRHRKAVHLMTPADTFPFASSTARDKQIDHTEPYQHGPGGPSGQSRLGNYGPMTTFHHRVKTFGKWTVTRLARAS